MILGGPLKLNDELLNVHIDIAGAGQFKNIGKRTRCVDDDIFTARTK